MATNGTTNGANGVSGRKHYNEGTFLFTVSIPWKIGGLPRASGILVCAVLTAVPFL